MISSQITRFHEHELRKLAEENSRMKYMHVGLLGLSGQHHPIISGAQTTDEVNKMRPHLKMISGDYLTYFVKSQQSGGSPHCRLCGAPSETVSHVTVTCPALSDTRVRILTQLSSLTSLADTYRDNEELFSQFLIDPASFNLPSRVNISDPQLPAIYKICRDLCFSLDKERLEKLKSIQ